MIDGTDIDLSAAARRVRRAPLRVQDRHRDLSQTYVDGTNPVSGEAYPQTLAELIEFNQDHPELEGPWNDLVFELAEATNGRDEDAPTFVLASRRRFRTRSTTSWPRTTSTRSSR